MTSHSAAAEIITCIQTKVAVSGRCCFYEPVPYVFSFSLVLNKKYMQMFSILAIWNNMMQLHLSLNKTAIDCVSNCSNYDSWLYVCQVCRLIRHIRRGIWAVLFMFLCDLIYCNTFLSFRNWKLYKNYRCVTQVENWGIWLGINFVPKAERSW